MERAHSYALAPETDPAAQAEIEALRACVRNLLGLLALPAAWHRRSADDILQVLVEALAGVGRRDGARMLYFTAQPENPPAEQADRTVRITAQTMADDRESDAVLPMGSAYEIALFVLVDLITNGVRRRRSQTPEDLRSRHTNLE